MGSGGWGTCISTNSRKNREQFTKNSIMRVWATNLSWVQLRSELGNMSESDQEMNEGFIRGIWLLSLHNSFRVSFWVEGGNIYVGTFSLDAQVLILRGIALCRVCAEYRALVTPKDQKQFFSMSRFNNSSFHLPQTYLEQMMKLTMPGPEFPPAGRD